MLSPLKKFLHTPQGIGLLLFFILCIALGIANSPLYPAYQSFITLPLQLGVGSFSLQKPAVTWINDGLMSLFFLGLALEIKQEILIGELASFKKAALPVIGASGGVVLPALIFLICNHTQPHAYIGWPVPTATDVALALAAASALGKRVPTALKTFLLALAIVDDVVAILIIALIYTQQLSLLSIALALLGVVFLLLLNLLRVRRLAPYLGIGFYIWLCVLQSGVHATLAGVLVGFTIPFVKQDRAASPLISLNHTLHRWINFLILPLFIFFNGGLHFVSFTLSTLFSRVSVGTFLGLWLGKTLGIFTAAMLAIHLKLAHKPYGATWQQLLGISALGGIGFTMSLFLASLAFHLTDYEALARQGILMGSLLSLLTGWAIFAFSKKPLKTA